MGIDARLLADVARKELLDGIGDGVRPDHPQTAKRQSCNQSHLMHASTEFEQWALSLSISVSPCLCGEERRLVHRRGTETQRCTEKISNYQPKALAHSHNSQIESARPSNAQTSHREPR